MRSSFSDESDDFDAKAFWISSTSVRTSEIEARTLSVWAATSFPFSFSLTILVRKYIVHKVFYGKKQVRWMQTVGNLRFLMSS